MKTILKQAIKSAAFLAFASCLTFGAHAANVCKIERTGTEYETLSNAVSHAEANDTIKILAACNVGTPTFNKDITIDINGTNVTVDAAITVAEGTLTLTNAYSRAPAMTGSKGKVIIDASIAVAAGATLDLSALPFGGDVYGGMDGTEKSNLNLAKGATAKFYKWNVPMVDSANWMFYNYPAFFTDSKIPVGGIVKIGDKTWEGVNDFATTGITNRFKITGEVAAAYVTAQHNVGGDTSLFDHIESFTTVQAAFDAVKDGGMVTLSADIADAQAKFTRAISATLDLAGKTMCCASPKDEHNWYGFTLRVYKGTLTIADSLGGGKVVNTNDDSALRCCADGNDFTSEPKVIVLGGAFENVSQAESTIYAGAGSAQHGTIVISNAAVTVTNSYAGAFDFGNASRILNVGNGNPAGSSAITLYAGTYQVDPELGDDKLGGNYCAAGYIARPTAGGFVVGPGRWVAKVGDTKFEAVQDAYEAVPEGGTILLVADETINEDLAFAKTFTLDLDGHVFVASNVNVTAGTVSLINSTFNPTLPLAGGKGLFVPKGVISVAANAGLDLSSLPFGVTYGGVEGPGSLSLAAGATAKFYKWGVPSVDSANWMFGNYPAFFTDSKIPVGGIVKIGDKTWTGAAGRFILDGEVAIGTVTATHNPVLDPAKPTFTFTESFDSVAKAIAAVDSGTTVRLVGAASLDSGVAKALTLELNGQELSLDGTVAISENVTVRNGVAQMGGLKNAATISVAAGKTLDLSTLSWGAGGFIPVNGGALAIASGATVKMGTPDGRSPNWMVANNEAFLKGCATGAKLVIGGTEYTKSDGLWTIKDAVATAEIATKGAQGQDIAYIDSFASLADAVAAVKAGGKITVIAACKVGTPTFNKDITIDINGTNVLVDTDLMVSAGMLTLTNAYSKAPAMNVSKGKVIIDASIAVAAGATLDLSALPFGGDVYGGMDGTEKANLDLAADATAKFYKWGDLLVDGAGWMFGNYPAFFKDSKIPVGGIVIIGDKRWTGAADRFVIDNEVAIAPVVGTHNPPQTPAEFTFVGSFDQVVTAITATTNGATVTMTGADSIDAALTLTKDLTIDIAGTNLTVNAVVTNTAGKTLKLVNSAWTPQEEHQTPGQLLINKPIVVTAGATLDLSEMPFGAAMYGGIDAGAEACLDLADGSKAKFYYWGKPSKPEVDSANWMYNNLPPFFKGGVIPNGAIVTIGEKTWTGSTTLNRFVIENEVAIGTVASEYNNPIAFEVPFTFTESFDSVSNAIFLAKAETTVTLVDDASLDSAVAKALTLELNGQELSLTGTVAISENVVVQNNTTAGGLKNSATISVAAGKTLDLSTLSWGVGGFIPVEGGALAIKSGATVKMGSPDGRSPNWMAANNPAFLADCETGAKLVIDGMEYTKHVDGYWTIKDAVATAEIAAKGARGQDLVFIEPFTSLAAAVAAVKIDGKVTLVADCHTATVDKQMTLVEGAYVASNLTLTASAVLTFADVTEISPNALRNQRPDLLVSLEADAQVFTDKLYFYLKPIDAFIPDALDWEAAATTDSIYGEYLEAYPTFAEAFAQVTTNGTIYTLRDSETAGFAIKYGLTIDLVTAEGNAGYTLAITNATSKTTGVEIMPNTTDVTIRGGTLAAAADAGLVTLLSSGSADLVLDGVTIDGAALSSAKTAYAFYATAGNVTVTNRTTFTLPRAKGYALYAGASGKSAGVAVAFCGTNTVTGNIVVNQVNGLCPVTLALDGVGFSAGYALTFNNGNGFKETTEVTTANTNNLALALTLPFVWSEVGEGLWQVARGQASLNGKPMTLQQAMDTVKDGETVTLNANIALDSALVITNTHSFNFDLAGHKLTSPVVVSNATVAVDGTEAKLVGGIFLGEGARVTVVGGEYDGRFVATNGTASLSVRNADVISGAAGLAAIEIGDAAELNLVDSRVTGGSALRVAGGAATITNTRLASDGTASVVVVDQTAGAQITVNFAAGTVVRAPINTIYAQFGWYTNLTDTAVVTKHVAVDLIAPKGYSWTGDAGSTELKLTRTDGAKTFGVGIAEDDLVITKNLGNELGAYTIGGDATAGWTALLDETPAAPDDLKITLLDTKILLTFTSVPGVTYDLLWTDDLSKPFTTVDTKTANETTTSFTPAKVGDAGGYYTVRIRE